MNRVTPMPRQCKAPTSIFSSMGMIIAQISTATGRLTCATCIRPIAWNGVGNQCPIGIPATMQSATHSVR
jgi:hypothetical protein